MLSSTLPTAAVLLSVLSTVQAQTFTNCNPMEKTCPADPALGTTQFTPFTSESSDWTLADGTTMKYGSDGAEFIINKGTDAPTISSTKYIFFGKVTATVKSNKGVGTVSSFILESDDLDEIDWEWLGSTNGNVKNVESNFFGKGDTSSYDRAVYHDTTTPQDTWHTYVIDWTKDYVRWSIDGTQVRELLYNDPLTHGGHNFPQTPMKIKMGNWVGCVDINDASKKGTCDWAGGQADFVGAPYTMYVKDVTIEDYGCGTEYTYSDLTGSYQSIKTSGDCGGNAVSSGASSATKSLSSTSSGAIFASSSSSVISTSSAAPTTSASSTIKPITTGSSNSTIAVVSPTLATSIGTGATTPKTSAPSQTTSSSPQQVTSANSGTSTKEKKKYGMADFVVIVLGLGLGYLVM